MGPDKSSQCSQILLDVKNVTDVHSEAALGEFGDELYQSVGVYQEDVGGRVRHHGDGVGDDRSGVHHLSLAWSRLPTNPGLGARGGQVRGQRLCCPLLRPRPPDWPHGDGG